MIKKVIFLCSLSGFSLAQGHLENPAKDKVDSGIGVISGWHCTASEVEVWINERRIGIAGSGTERPDTVSICGHSDTGFSLLFNYGELAEGEHSVAVYADGDLFAEHSFKSVKAGGGNFVRNLKKTINVSGFPDKNSEAQLEWSTAKQSFSVEKVTPRNYDYDRLIEIFNTPQNRPHWPLSMDSYTGRSEGFRGGSTGSLSIDTTRFKFNIDKERFSLVRKGLASGICEFQGKYEFYGDRINTTGSYQCDDSSRGTYSANGLNISPLGVYTGEFVMTSAGGSAVVVDKHVGM